MFMCRRYFIAQQQQLLFLLLFWAVLNTGHAVIFQLLNSSSSDDASSATLPISQPPSSSNHLPPPILTSSSSLSSVVLQSGGDHHNDGLSGGYPGHSSAPAQSLSPGAFFALNSAIAKQIEDGDVDELRHRFTRDGDDESDGNIAIGRTEAEHPSAAHPRGVPGDGDRSDSGGADSLNGHQDNKLINEESGKSDAANIVAADNVQQQTADVPSHLAVLLLRSQDQAQVDTLSSPSLLPSVINFTDRLLRQITEWFSPAKSTPTSQFHSPATTTDEQTQTTKASNAQPASNQHQTPPTIFQDFASGNQQQLLAHSASTAQIATTTATQTSPPTAKVPSKSEQRFIPNVSGMRCIPGGIFRACVNLCYEDSNKYEQSGPLLFKGERGPALDSSGISGLLRCVRDCRSEYIDTTIPGCVTTGGRIIPGGPADALDGQQVYPESIRKPGSFSYYISRRMHRFFENRFLQQLLSLLLAAALLSGLVVLVIHHTESNIVQCAAVERLIESTGLNRVFSWVVEKAEASVAALRVRRGEDQQQPGDQGSRAEQGEATDGVDTSSTALLNSEARAEQERESEQE